MDLDFIYESSLELFLRSQLNVSFLRTPIQFIGLELTIPNQYKLYTIKKYYTTIKILYLTKYTE